MKKQISDMRASALAAKCLYSLSVLFLCAGLSACRETAAPPEQPLDPNMGDWKGSYTLGEKVDAPLVAQVIALGGGRYEAKLLPAFARRVAPLAVLRGETSGGAVRFRGVAESLAASPVKLVGEISGEAFSGTIKGAAPGSFELKNVVRRSPTLGAPPPEGAIVLFDGSSLAQWQHPGQMIGLVDLANLLGGEDAAAYLREQVWSETAQHAVLELGSDDGIKAWVNGELVHANNASRGVAPGEDRAPVQLRQGWNTVLLKITQGGGGWGACAKLVAPDGAPLTTIAEKIPGAGTPDGERTFLEARQSFLTAWELAGPFRTEGKKGSELFDMPFVPETAPAEADWRPLSMSPPDRTPRWELADGAMRIKPGSGSLVTTRTFTDFKLHLEFRTPFMPDKRGQARGNSGVYLQGRYEIQVLDSYGLEGRDNECGGIYKVAAPRVNMCAPPGQWQTYDITFRAPRFAADGRSLAPARVTVLHNGVMIHENQDLPAPTGGELDHNLDAPGGIMLQDHGNRVEYRNIWLVELAE